MDIGALSVKIETEGLPEASQRMGDLTNAAKVLEGRTLNLESVVRSMSGSFIGTTAIITGTTAAILEAYNYTDKLRESFQQTVHSLAAAGGAAQGYARSLREEIQALQDADTPMGKLLHSTDRMEVLKAKLYALGPDYRQMIDDEVSSYGDLLKVIDKINAATMKKVELQIQDQERQVKAAQAPGWLTNLGTALRFAPGAAGGVGDYLNLRGMTSDFEKLNKENEKLNKLFADRAKLMDKSEFKPLKESADQATESLTLMNRELYRLEPLLHQLRQEKVVPDDLLAPLDVVEKLNFKPVQSYDDLLLRDLKLRAQAGDTWAILGHTITQSSESASYALANWMDNLDGLGRTWETLGDTVRNVLADMLRQMERAIIEQKLMAPLFNALGVTVGNIGGGGFGGTTPTGGGTPWWGVQSAPSYVPPAAAGAAMVNAPITVSIADGHVQTDAKGQSSAIAQSLKGAMNQWAVDNMRPGGLLAPR